MTDGLHRHSVVIHGHKTSVSLEPPFWDALKAIAGARGLSLNRLIAEIDHERQANLSSAIRLHVLKWTQEQPSITQDDALEKVLE